MGGAEMTIPRTRAALRFIHDRAPRQLGPHHFTDVTIETTEYVVQIGNRAPTKMAIAETKTRSRAYTVHQYVIEGMTSARATSATV